MQMTMPVDRLRSRIRAARTLARDSGGLSCLARVACDILRRKLQARWLLREMKLVHGPRRIPGGPLDVVLLCSLRDGASYLRSFLDHHRRLGVGHFVFLDNGSEDGTREMLLRQRDVTVYISRLPYKTYKHHFKRFLIRAHGRSRWSLLADIDEYFDFPGSSHLRLPQFCRYLEERGFDAVVAHMLDLFGSRPILDASGAGGVPEFRAEHRYYDLHEIEETDHAYAFGVSNEISNPAIKCLSGGIHSTVFKNTLLLTKHPLLKWRPPMELPRYSHDIRRAKLADVSAVFYHYKFTDEFPRVLARAIDEGGYYDGSSRYRRISERLKTDTRLSLLRPTSRELRSVEDLVSAGFLQVSPAFREWSAAVARAACGARASDTKVRDTQMTS